MKARDLCLIVIAAAGLVALPILFKQVMDLTVRPQPPQLHLPFNSTVGARAAETLCVVVDGKGVVYRMAPEGRVVLDVDPEVHELSGLRECLKEYLIGAQTTGHEPSVQIDADAASTQQRVIDILEALTAEGVTSVTFNNLIDPS